MKPLAGFSLIVALLLMACGAGDEAAGPGDGGADPGVSRVTGRVTNVATGAPIAEAHVSIGAATATTGPDGRFLLTGLTAGGATLGCTAPGFEELETGITLTSGTVTHDIVLARIYVPPDPDAGRARLRVLHAETAWPTMDVFVDGSRVLNDLPSLAASDYLEVEAGRRHLAFQSFQGWESIDANLAAGAGYTAIPCCSVFPNSYLLADDSSEPGAGNARLRVIHLARETDLHIYVTAPGADLAATSPTFTVPTSYASDYIELPAGDYQVRATRFDNTVVLLDSGTLTLGAGQVRSAVAVNASGGGKPFGLLLLADRD